MIRDYRKRKLQQAFDLSVDDLQNQVKDLIDTKDPAKVLHLVKNTINSTVWIGRNAIDYGASHLNPEKHNEKIIPPTSLEIELLEDITNKKNISPTRATFSEIFKVIFNERIFSHYDHSYQPITTIPKISSTLVLVPGVFNEVFSSAAFERGAKHLEKSFGIKYFSPKVKGTKSAEENAHQLAEQIIHYSEENPDERLWILAFSKGGIDCFRFLKDHHEFASDHIDGISTIATPIMGTSHFEHRLIKIANKIHEYDDNFLYKAIDDRLDILFKDIQKSLASDYQVKWFENNYDKLPPNLFYTALALESDWYDSHIWMIITKAFLQSKSINDGVVDIENAFFPEYFNGINLGVISGHHLVGNRSSKFNQEALLETFIIFLEYCGLLKEK